MARFWGRVGYSTTAETAPDVWTPTIVERVYSGSYLNETVSSQEADKVNDDIRLSSRISIVADAQLNGNYSEIKYVVDETGVCWSVTSVQKKRPRLILSTGGVYNGRRAQPEPPADDE